MRARAATPVFADWHDAVTAVAIAIVAPLTSLALGFAAAIAVLR